jgi:hypothetical protein
MTTDLRSRLTACKQSPLDSSLRTNLADALATLGQSERAEFVRLQVRADEHGPDWYPGQAEDRAREAELRRRFTTAWTGGRIDPENGRWFVFEDGPPAEDEASSWPGGKFERGLVHLAGCPVRLPAVFDRLPGDVVPWVETLAVSGVTSDLAALRRLFARPPVGEITAFSFHWTGNAPPGLVDLLDRPTVRSVSPGGGEGSGQLLRRLASADLRPHKLGLSPDPTDPESWAALMGSPVLAEVRDLGLCGPGRAWPPLGELARAPHLARLSRLYLSGDGPDLADLRALFASPGVAGLTQLNISGYSGKLFGVVSALTPSRSIRGLETLDLSFNSVSAAEAAALARSPLSAALRRLSFGSGALPPEGLKALAGSPLLARLESLNLSCAGVGDVGLIALARSPHLRNLRRLSVCRCGVTSRGLRALAGSPLLSQLDDLDLSLNPLEPDALAVLVDSPRLANLRRLALRALGIDPETFRRLVCSPALARLEHLDLQSTALSLAHVRALAGSTALTGLRKLVFYKAPLLAGEIDALMDAPCLAGLIELVLCETGLTDEGVERLTRRADLARLRDLDLSKNRITQRGAEVLLAWPGLPRLVDLSVYGNALDETVERQLQAALS